MLFSLDDVKPPKVEVDHEDIKASRISRLRSLTSYKSSSTLKESEFDLLEEAVHIPVFKKSQEYEKPDDDFDIVDYKEEVKKSNQAHEIENRLAFVNHAYDEDTERDTYILAHREYTLLEKPAGISQSTASQIDNDDTDNGKQKSTWTKRFKEGLGNLVYKMNHKTDWLSQYKSLDFKIAHKHHIKLILGHEFYMKNWVKDVEEIFKNIILFTYRKHFKVPLETVSKKSGKPKKLVSDFGWGCMIRWGQMMLANAILHHLKSMIFNKASNKGLSIVDISEFSVYESLESEVLSKFMDSQKGKDAPFSIHQIVDKGLELFHKIAGDWYGTNSISQVLKEWNSEFKPYEDFEILVFNDGIIFKNEIILLTSEEWKVSKFSPINETACENTLDSQNEEDYFERTRRQGGQSGGSDAKHDFAKDDHKSQHSGGGSDASPQHERIDMGTWSFSNENVFTYKEQLRKWNKSVLIIINIRLGLKKIPEDSYREITRMFNLKQWIGIIGGRGKFGLYFVGHQKDNLILLDPHFNQETVSKEEDIKSSRDTYRWHDIKTLKIKKIDPWIGIGFVITSYKDYTDFMIKIERYNSSPDAIFGLQDMKVYTDQNSVSNIES